MTNPRTGTVWLLAACAFAATAQAEVRPAQPELHAARDAAARVAVRIGSADVAMADVEARMKVERDALQARYDAQVRRLDAQLAKASTALLERTVDVLVDERVLALEAAKRGTTPEALLAALPQPAVSDGDVTAFYEANRARFAQPLEQVEPQIRAMLATRAAEPARRKFLDELRRGYDVSYAYAPPRYDVGRGGEARGAADAPVTIVEFADFQCPYCANLAPVLDRVVTDYAGRVRHVYRHFPLTSIHAQAYGAALAGVCAAEQHRFWEMHSALYADASQLQRDALVATAVRLGMQREPFVACLDSERARGIVEADLAAARTLPVEGTPSLFVNGRMFLGSLTYESLVRYVDEELARARVPAKTASAK